LPELHPALLLIQYISYRSQHGLVNTYIDHYQLAASSTTVSQLATQSSPLFWHNCLFEHPCGELKTGIMKAIMVLLAGSFLTGFSNRPMEDDIDGIWMGYYRSEVIKERVIVKFSNEDKIEFYTGGVDDKTKCNGSYRLLGDSVSFTYKTPEGQEYLMQGHINRRKNFVDGVWKTNDKGTGSFYLEKQEVEEKFINP
jgi:hypothetical protein